MSKLKRNTIELVEEIKEGEIVTQTYVTPVFIPFSVVYEALDLLDQSDDENATEKDLVNKMLDFVATKIYAGQFTKEDLMNKLHAPDAIQALQEQVLFVAQGRQTDATKEFLAKKR